MKDGVDISALLLDLTWPVTLKAQDLLLRTCGLR